MRVFLRGVDHLEARSARGGHAPRRLAVAPATGAAAGAADSAVKIHAARALLYLAALLAFGAPACQGDTIERVDGRKIESVKVLMARWDTVVYRDTRTTGAPLNLSLDGTQVLSIHRESKVLERLQQVIAEGNYRLAWGILKAVSGKSDWIRAQGMYLLARAHISDGEAAEAEKVLRTYLEEYSARKDYFVPSAMLSLADILASSGKAREAHDLYAEVESFGGQWIVRAKLGKAESTLALEGRKGAIEAERLFGEVSARKAAPASIRLRAVIGKGKALLARGRSDAAIRWLQAAFFDEPRPRDLAFTAERAEASLVLARACMKNGALRDLQDAEIWLLRIPALYARERGVLSEAVNLLVEVYEKLGNEERADEWRRYIHEKNIALVP